MARGFTQKQGVDYNNTYSPTLKYDSLRTITALAVINGFNIYQIDIKSAYLNAELDEEVYMEIVLSIIKKATGNSKRPSTDSNSLDVHGTIPLIRN